MHRVSGLVLFLFINTGVYSLTNNANISWFEEGDVEPKFFHAGEVLPRGLQNAYKIVVNQEFPVLWEVKFSYFDKLEVLVLDTIGVVEIKPGTFKDLKPLTNLSISHNKVNEIRNNVFNNVQVINLDLSHNEIENIASEAFNDMPVLQSLFLDFNKIKRWKSDWFQNCPKIRTLSFSHNDLEKLPENAFKNLQSKSVNFHFNYNQIRNIHSKAFNNLQSVGDVILSNNQIEVFNEDVFNDLTNVGMLDLRYNPLTCPSEKFIKYLINNKNAKLFYDCAKES